MARTMDRRQFLGGVIAFGVAGAFGVRRATDRGPFRGEGALRASDPSLMFTPQQFGAHADGIRDDHAAIMRADAAAAAHDGGIVYYGPGTYRTSQPIVPSSRVSHIGAGMKVSTITALPSDFPNFSFNYIFSGTNPDVVVAHLRIDGAKRNGSNPANECGLLSLGTRWHVDRVWFYDPNYFGLWVGTAAVDSTVARCRSSYGGNNDNIGGGGGQSVRIRSHFWDSTLTSNCFDNVIGDDVILSGGVNASNSNFYFEGMTQSGIENVTFLGSGGIVIESDGGYSPATITQPYACFARHNRLEGGGAIELAYSYNTPAQPGGANQIDDNYVVNALDYGILIVNGNMGATAQTKRDKVCRNVIINPNASNSASFNTGSGNIRPGGINVAGSSGLQLSDNICVDTRGAHHMLYGIELGATSTAASTNVLCESNIVSGYVTDAVGITNVGSGVEIRGNGDNSRVARRVLQRALKSRPGG